MAEYIKTRKKLADGKYDIENTESFQFVNDIKTQFPGNTVDMVCDGDTATISIDKTLDAQEQTDLTLCISTSIAAKVIITE